MKIQKVSFSFSDGQYLDWCRLEKPVVSESGSNMYWEVHNGIKKCFTSGNPSVSYSLWLLSFLSELE
jgi:hypothetical protein